MNIVTEIMRYASPVVIDRLANALGIKSSLVRMAITYAVPAILGAFASKAATPQGASALLNAAKSTDMSMLGSLEQLVGGAGQDAFVKSGSSMLSSVLGNDGVSNILGSLTKSSGVSSAAAATLLPMVGQMVLGGLSKNAGGLDASGLANMLMQQKDNIASAMPSVSTPHVSPPPAPPAAASSMLRWLVPLIALAALGFYFFGNSTPPAPTGTVPTAVMIDGQDVGKTITDTLASATATLGTITDAASAQAALPKLQESVTAVDGLAGMASKFTAEHKTLLGSLISAGMPALKAAAEKALAVEGVGAIAKPVVDGLLTKIEGLAK